MNRHISTTPKTAFIIGAVVMTVLTLGASVTPAWQESGTHAAVTVAYAAVDVPAATEVAIIPERIEVVGQREPRTVFGAVRQLFTRKAQSS